MERLSVSAPRRSDGARRLQVRRWYVWRAAAGKEAKLSRNKRRTLLVGQGPQAPTPCAPAASAVSAASRGDGEVAGAGSAREAAGGRATAAASQPAAVAAAVETSTPQGGPRPGPGRLGAEASPGAARVAGRPEALAGGQRGPGGGPGTF